MSQAASNTDYGNKWLPKNLPAPTAGGDAARKSYVDGLGIPTIDEQWVQSAVQTTSASTTYVALSLMTLTAKLTGKYAIFFNANTTNTISASTFAQIAINGSAVTGSEMQVGAVATQQDQLSLAAFNISVVLGDVVTIQWHVNGGTGAITKRQFGIIGVPSTYIVP